MTMNLRARSTPRRVRGAALLIAMVILTLVATLAAGMVWQQWRSIEVESAERARIQAEWLLDGALDWTMLLVQSNSNKPYSVNDAWATPLAEARLSTFLAADKQATDDNESLDAFLSGSISDAQARYNLANLIDGQGKVDPAQLAILQRLCGVANVPSGDADRIADGLSQAFSKNDTSPLVPANVAQFSWLGVDPKDLARLEPWVTMLPQKTAVNVNTAPREVLAAVLNISMADADRITQMRVPNALTLGNLQSQFPGLPPPNGVPATGTQGSTPQQPGQQQGSSTPLYGITTSYFYVQGQIRLGDRVVQERSLVQVGRGARPVVLQRDWISGVTSSS